MPVMASLLLAPVEFFGPRTWRLNVYGDAGYALWGAQPGERRRVDVPGEGPVRVEVRQVLYRGGSWDRGNVERYLESHPELEDVQAQLKRGRLDAARDRLRRLRPAFSGEG